MHRHWQALIGAGLLVLACGAPAQGLDRNDVGAMQRVIDAQLDAFARDDTGSTTSAAPCWRSLQTWQPGSPGCWCREAAPIQPTKATRANMAPSQRMFRRDGFIRPCTLRSASRFQPRVSPVVAFHPFRAAQIMPTPQTINRSGQ
jgi:hypothetical protein